MTATSVLSPAQVSAAKSDMSNILPDDSYVMSLPPFDASRPASADVCGKNGTGPKYHWGCVADPSPSYFNGSDSHQYITLAQDSINDDPDGGLYKFGHTANFEIVTDSPSSKTVYIDVVDRGIGDTLACKNQITAFYYHGVDPEAGIRTFSRLDAPNGRTTKCQQSYKFVDNFPKDFFDSIPNQDGSPSGLYRGRIVLFFGNTSGGETNDAKTQTSFHIRTTSASTWMGYVGEADTTLYPTTPKYSGEHAWINSYPTNLATGHTMRFYFRPDCTVPEGDKFTIEFDDADGNTPYQPVAATVKVYKFRPGNIGSRQILTAAQDGASGTLNSLMDYRSVEFKTTQYGGNQNFAYMVQIDNVYGGNGISFKYPYSSSGARMECPSFSGWTLNGTTSVDDNVIGVGVSTNFRHSVQNNGPRNASYNWVVQESYNRVDWDNTGTSGSCSNQAPRSNCPNRRAVPFTFPSDKPDRARYCQRIFYTRAIVPNAANPDASSSGTSRERCVTYDAPASDSDCIGEYTHNMQANSRYRFTVFNRNTDHYVSEPSSPATNNNAWAQMSTADYVTTVSPADVGNTNREFTYTFPAPTGPDWQIYIERWERISANNYEYHGGETSVFAAGNCYNASCTIDSITADPDAVVPGSPSKQNPVKVEGAFTVGVTIKNNGRAAIAQPGRSLSIIGGAGSTWTGYLLALGSSTSQQIGKGGSKSFTFPLTMPSGVGSHPLKSSLQYNFNMGPCNDVSVSGYGFFQLTPKASFDAVSAENPDVIGYTTGIEATTVPDPPASIPATATNTIYRNDNPVETASRTERFTTRSYPQSYTNSAPIIMGDRYCLEMTINNGTGWIGPDDDIADPASATTTPPSCFTVNNKPYVHFLGGDVSAGGGFDGASCTAKGGINTYFNNIATPSGSGVQIGALAIGNIYGFSSALVRNSDPKPPTGLTFANTGTTNVNATGGPTSNASDAGTGGGMNNTHCLTDFTTKIDKKYKDAPYTTTSASPTQGDTRYYKPPAGQEVQISGGELLSNYDPAFPLTTRATSTVIYIEGNARITDDIKYKDAGNYGGINNVPSLVIVVLGGTLTINPNVKQLDGIYVSQPLPKTELDGSVTMVGGDIYTCPSPTALPAPTAIPYRDSVRLCGQQLVVNGQFVAARVHLLRAHGSLRDALAANSPSGDAYRTGGPAKTCSIDTANGGAGARTGNAFNDCAGEVFRFSPELYLGQPDMIPSTGPTNDEYDYITNLPPVL